MGAELKSWLTRRDVAGLDAYEAAAAERRTATPAPSADLILAEVAAAAVGAGACAAGILALGVAPLAATRARLQLELLLMGPLVWGTEFQAARIRNQLLDVGFGPGATWPSVLAPVVLVRDQVSVPTKQSIWCHQDPDLEKPFSIDRFGLDGESAALPIGESRSLAAQLLAQRSVTRKPRFLLLEIFDYVPLMPIDQPAKISI